MKTPYDSGAPQRPANLSLNEDLVAQARALTGNLSGVVESLSADYVERERRQQLAKNRALGETIALWNDFNTKHGSFADEHSPL